MIPLSASEASAGVDSEEEVLPAAVNRKRSREEASLASLNKEQKAKVLKATVEENIVEVLATVDASFTSLASTGQEMVTAVGHLGVIFGRHTADGFEQVVRAQEDGTDRNCSAEE